MGITIKKFSKRAAFSLVLTAGIFLAFIARLFFGAGHINLSRLNSSEKNPVSSEMSFGANSAKADVPGGACGCGDSGGEGATAGDGGAGCGGGCSGSGSGDSGDSGGGGSGGCGSGDSSG